jgi:cell wall-associated NlpC family hydrolase
MSEQLQRNRVIEEARSWVGTPYHHLADVKGVGVDCAMILVRVYGDAGVIQPFDPRPYPRDWHMHRDAELYLGWLEKVGEPTDNPRPGDVAVWRFGRCYSHGGVIVGDNQIIHSYIKQGVVIASMQEQHLASRPVKFFTLWGKNERRQHNDQH